MPSGLPVALSADEVAELYDRHAEAILAFLVRRTWDPEVAVDILTETFAVALEGRRRFRGHDHEAARAWLYGIARHHLTDHFRRDGVFGSGTLVGLRESRDG